MAEAPRPVLLLEDDANIRHFVRTALEAQGIKVLEASRAQDGLALARRGEAGLLILDLGLPDLDGLEVIRQLRTWSGMPILVLSARNQEEAKVAALDAGADDYLTKPFGVGELLARARAASRRASGALETLSGYYSADGLEVDLDKHRVRRDGYEVHLTPIEHKLLAALLRNRGRVMTHRQLLKEVWGGEHSEDNHYVRIYMAQLRSKLEHDPAQPKLLLTETGVGYRFADAAED